MNQQKENEENQSLEQNQNQAGPEPGRPEVMQQEPPRKCKICGGPNHYGCGCEARQRQAASKVSTENLTKEQKPEPTDEEIQKVLSYISDESIDKAIKRGDEIFGHIEAMSDNISDIYAILGQIKGVLCSLHDYITKVSTESAEVKNGD